MKKVGYFVDCFDPITNQHIEFAKKLVRDNQLSVLYFVIKDAGNADYLHRLNMIHRAIAPYRKFRVSVLDLQEEKLIDTYELNELDNASKKVREGAFGNLCYANKCYIMKFGLYADSIIKANLKPKRYNHSLSVAQLCKEIADGNHLDSHKAYLIGMYHDIAKNMEVKQMENLMNIYKPYEINMSVPVWHQYLGEYVLSSKLKMKDKQALKAIRHHCLGDDQSVYSKVIFVADKLDPSRGYDSSKEIEISIQNIELGFEIVKKQNEEYLKKEGVK